MYRIGLLVCCVWLMSTNLYAQYTLSGKVLDADTLSLSGAYVMIHETNRVAMVSDQGTFQFQGLKPGTYHIHVTSVGYHAVEQNVWIKNQDVSLQIFLQPSVNQLHEVIVESSVLKNNQEESSLTTQHVNEGFINQQAGSTLMESLSNLAGVSNMNMGVGVSKPMIRGMYANRVIVTDNGIKQEGQQWAQDHGLEIDQHNIEEVEVVKGPASLAYGSDAMGGVVAVKHPKNMSEGEQKTRVSYLYRDNNNTHGLTGYSKGNIKGLYYNARMTWLKYSDYRVPADSFRYDDYNLPIYNKRLKNTAGNELHYSFTAGFNRTWGYSHLTFSQYNQEVGVFSGAVGIPRAYQLTPDGSDDDIALPRQRVRHTKLISNSNILIGKNWLELDMGFQHNFRGEYSQPSAHGASVLGLSDAGILLNLYTYSLNARYHVHSSEKRKSTVGLQASVMDNQIGGWEFIIPAYQQQQGGLFFIQQWNLNKRWVVNGGLRLETAAQQIQSSTYAFYYQNNFIGNIVRNQAIHKQYINYALSAGSSYMLSEYMNVKFNAGKTYRIPTPIELGSNGPHHGAFRYEVGDENLKPEEGYQFDLAFVYERKRLEFSLSPYYNRFQNFIYLQPSGSFARVTIDDQVYPYPSGSQVYTYQQGAVNHMGYEFSASYKLLSWLTLETTGDYVYMLNRDNQEFIPFTPPPRWIKGFRLEKRRRQKTLENIYFLCRHHDVYAQNRVARNEEATAGYALIDLGAGTRIRKGIWYFDVNLQVRNVLDEKYFNHLSRYRLINVPEQGRNVVLQVILYFDKPGK